MITATIIRLHSGQPAAVLPCTERGAVVYGDTWHRDGDGWRRGRYRVGNRVAGDLRRLVRLPCAAVDRDGQLLTALVGPHGEVAELLGETDYFGVPGVYIRQMAGVVAVPASHIGTEWRPVPGTVVTLEYQTGRWTTPVERRLGIVDAPVA